MLAILGPDAPLHENMSPAKIRSLMSESGADILVAGGRNQYLAIKEGFPFIDANQERHTAYAGYEGLVNLAQRMSEAIEFYRIGREGVAPPSPRVTTARRGGRGRQPAAPLRRHRRRDGAAGRRPRRRRPPRRPGLLLPRQGAADEALPRADRAGLDEDLLGGPRARRPGADRRRRAGRRRKAEARPGRHALLRSLRGQGGRPGSPRCAASTPDPPPSCRSATPDYAGGLEEGFAAAVTALLALATPGTRDARRVNILAGPGLTPADCRELHTIAAAFGLEATILPDLSALEGGRRGYSGLTAGGTPLAGDPRHGQRRPDDCARREPRRRRGQPGALLRRAVSGPALPDRPRRGGRLLRTARGDERPRRPGPLRAGAARSSSTACATR